MIETLQGCRIIFMFLIFMSHFTWMNSEEFCFGGDCGVSFFFMLSGFVLCHAHGKEVTDSRFGHKRFILRQLSKIYPLHIATLLATILNRNKGRHISRHRQSCTKCNVASELDTRPRHTFRFQQCVVVSVRHHVLLPYVSVARKMHDEG